jgi:hypothetical protein
MMTATQHATTARPYTYATDLMTKKVPLSTAREVRSCLFPASNHAYAPGMHASSSTAAAAPGAPVKVLFEDGSYVMVTGKRVERHRRSIDYILAYAPAIPVGNDEHVFFLDLKKGAEKVFGDPSYYTRFAETILSMRAITLDYHDADGDRKDDIPDQANTLVTDFVREFKPGVDVVVDTMVRHCGYSLADVDGKCMVRLSRVYMRHLANGLTLSYHAALEHIFRMGPVAAQLARMVLSQKYLRARSLRDLLELIGAPTGAAQDRAIRELRTGDDAKLLAELGIAIREYGPRRQLVVDYVANSEGRTFAITQKLVNGRRPSSGTSAR